MVKFSGLTQDGKGRLIGIALSRVNCERLLEGQPIAFDLAEIGLGVCDVPGGTGTPNGPPMSGHVLIVAGETELAIMEEMEATARAAGVEFRGVEVDFRFGEDEA